MLELVEISCMSIYNNKFYLLNIILSKQICRLAFVNCVYSLMVYSGGYNYVQLSCNAHVILHSVYSISKQWNYVNVLSIVAHLIIVGQQFMTMA